MSRAARRESERQLAAAKDGQRKMNPNDQRLWIGSIALMAVVALCAHLGQRLMVPLKPAQMRAIIQPDEVETADENSPLPWWLRTTPWSEWANGLAYRKNAPSGIDAFVSNAGLTTPALERLPPAGRRSAAGPRALPDKLPEKLCTLHLTPAETVDQDYYIVAEASGLKTEAQLTKGEAHIEAVPASTAITLHLEMDETHFLRASTRARMSEDVVLAPEQKQITFVRGEKLFSAEVARGTYLIVDHQNGAAGHAVFVSVPKARTLSKSYMVDLASNPTDEMLFRGEDEKLIILIVGSSDLSEAVWCERPGTGDRIGVYSDQTPMLIAMVDASSWIKVSARAMKLDQPLKYTVYAFSGSALSSKQAFLGFLDTLYGDEPNHTPTDPAQMRSLSHWLALSLDLHFSAEDRDLCRFESERIIINSLLEPHP